MIRGGSLRIVGYGVGVLFYLATAPFLIRHLGVEQFGGYVAVLALIGIIALVSDAGLTLVGVREYAARDGADRMRLLENLLALRLLVAAAGVAAALTFTTLAGYSDELVAGTALAGVGLLLLVVQQTYGVALISQVRVGSLTALEVGRQALTAAGLLTLIALGATVSWLLAVSIPIGLLLAAVCIRIGPAVRPRLDRHEARYLIREAIPVAIASTIGSMFYRSAVVVMSITATQAETSYFSASYRVIESLIAIPSLLCATVFPILARAATNDQDRIASALQRLAEVGLILGAGSALTLALAARPAIAFLAGPEFEPSVIVLQIQAAALPASFLVSVWATGLWALRGQRGLAIANAIGVTLAIALAAVAGPLAGARGVAMAMLAAEWVLAALYLVALIRLRSGLRPNIGVLWKVLLATAAGLCAVALPVPDLVRATLGAIAYMAIIIWMRAIPGEVWLAFRAVMRRRDPPEATAGPA